ncbi:hypothetical protein ABVT39_023236 [Epinephelus coioides]
MWDGSSCRSQKTDMHGLKFCSTGHSVGYAEKTGDTEVPVAGYRPDSSGFNTGDGSSWSTVPFGGGGSTSNANKASRYNIPLLPSYYNDSELQTINLY